MATVGVGLLHFIVMAVPYLGLCYRSDNNFQSLSLEHGTTNYSIGSAWTAEENKLWRDVQQMFKTGFDLHRCKEGLKADCKRWRQTLRKIPFVDIIPEISYNGLICNAVDNAYCENETCMCEVGYCVSEQRCKSNFEEDSINVGFMRLRLKRLEEKVQHQALIHLWQLAHLPLEYQPAMQADRMMDDCKDNFDNQQCKDAINVLVNATAANEKALAKATTEEEVGPEVKERVEALKAQLKESHGI